MEERWRKEAKESEMVGGLGGRVALPYPSTDYVSTQ